MSDTRRVRNDPVRGKSVMSTAVVEAFGYLNGLTRHYYRGAGDTPTAARSRAATKAGITPAQAERVWKRWQRMASVDGDVYRNLRNHYEAVCLLIEEKADALEARRMGRTPDAGHETVEGRSAADQGTEASRD